MADSPGIHVAYGEYAVPTDLTMWDMNPKSGSYPLTLNWEGYLLIPGYESMSEVCNDEYIQLQIEMPAGSGIWVDIPGAVVLTHYNSITAYNGYFSGTYTIPVDWPAGVYNFRVHYNGNISKGLAGCE